MLSTKLTLRLARRLQGAWEASRPVRSGHDNAWQRIVSRFELASRVQERHAFIAARYFPNALSNLTGDLKYHVGELAHLSALLRDELVAIRFPEPDLRHWLAEAQQIEAEFGTVEVKWKEKTLRAVTEPITLRNVELGPFAIDLHWDRLGSAKGVHCFDIVALEPNPASGREDVVHPHVQGNDLCAGDAMGPVQRALEQGRIVEAFLLIQSVLNNYNPSSPYVSLEQWSGTTCSDCGRRVDDEDRYSCESCDSDMCEHCAGSCACCLSSRCGRCLETCAICDSQSCTSCLTTVPDDRRVCTRCFVECADCDRRLPKDELIDKLCPTCSPEEENDDDDEVIHAGVEVA
jgi:hypothetical protein